jgi:NadR type nicotinamide-nucleotide adenylyltransferase
MNLSVKKIVITGPESTGKSTLTMDLAVHYNTEYIPEYARDYVANLQRPYQFSDLEHIARKQVKEIENFSKSASGYLFIDTHLIITKVWFDVVYGNCPQWIIDRISINEIDLYLLCNNDLPWIADNIRENGGEMRNILFNRYKEELDFFKLNYLIIEGQGGNRLQCAIKGIEYFFRSSNS